MSLSHSKCDEPHADSHFSEHPQNVRNFLTHVLTINYSQAYTCIHTLTDSSKFSLVILMQRYKITISLKLLKLLIS